MFSDRYGAAVITKTADRKTIMNCHMRGQTRKTIIDYHEPFDQGFTYKYSKLSTRHNIEQEIFGRWGGGGEDRQVKLYSRLEFVVKRRVRRVNGC